MDHSELFGGAANAPTWVSGATYAQYKVVRSPSDFQLYVRTTAAGSGVTDPSADSTNYRPAGGRAIKSVQRGTISLNSGATANTATISSVVTGKSELRLLGVSSSATDFASTEARIALTNGTTITATRNSSSTGDIVVSWEVTEYY